MMKDCLCINIRSTWRCLLTVTLFYFFVINCRAISPTWIVDTHDISATYNPAASIDINDKCRLNLIGSLGNQTDKISSQYYLFQGSLPIPTFYLDLGVGLDAEYHKSGDSNFKQFHIQLAGYNTFQFGTISYGIAPGFYSSTTSDENEVKHRHNRFSFNGGVMFESKLIDLGVSATQLFTGQNSMGHIYGRLLIPLKVIEIIPSAMHTTDFSYSRTDLLVQLRLKRKFTIGGGWSTSRIAAVTTRVDINDFYLGYAFTIPDHTSENKKISHQIYAGYSFKIKLNEPTRYISKSIRYM